MRGGLRSSGVESFRPAGEHWFRRQGAFRVQLRQRSDLTNVRSGPLCGLKSDISRGPRSARLGHRQIIRSPSSVSASNVGEAPKQWGELPVAIWLPVLRQVGQKALVERSARGLRRAVPPTKHGRDLHARRRGNRVKLGATNEHHSPRLRPRAGTGTPFVARIIYGTPLDGSMDDGGNRRRQAATEAA